MRTAIAPADCDCLVEMEDLGIGVREILQYARAVLTRREVSRLRAGLRRMMLGGSPAEAFRGEQPGDRR